MKCGNVACNVLNHYFGKIQTFPSTSSIVSYARFLVTWFNMYYDVFQLWLK